MPADVHKELKIALIRNDRNLADFFNSAAEEYLKKENNMNGRKMHEGKE